MASDDRILDELHFLTRKIQALEKKLETSLAIQEDLAASFLQEEDSLASTPTIKKSDRKRVSGSSCSEPNTSDDEINSSRVGGTHSEGVENEAERSTSYLIIPVGSYKDNDSCSLQKEKQTFTWSEIDHNAAMYVTCEGPFKSDKEEMSERLACDANQYHADIPTVSHKFGSFANQASLRPHHSRLELSEGQTCAQWNGNESSVIPLDDCLPNTSGTSCEMFAEDRNSRSAFHTGEDIIENMSAITQAPAPSNFKYGLTISIATAKAGSIQSVAQNHRDMNSSERIVEELYEENYETLKRGFGSEKIAKKGARIGQLRPLSPEESTMQSTHSSHEAVFDQICDHSLTPQHCDNERNTGYRLGEFLPERDICCVERDNEFPYRVIEVDSELSKHDQTYCDFVDTYAQDYVSIERNGGSLHANPRDAFKQTLAATKADGKQAKMDYQQVEKNRMYENDVYLTDQGLASRNGNYRFKQFEDNCDAVSEKVIEMQISHIAEEQRSKDDYYAREGSQAGNRLTNNASHKRVNVEVFEARSYNDLENVNKQRGTLSDHKAIRTKPSHRKIDSPVSQFNDQVYGIIGNSDTTNDYKAIKKYNEERTRVKTRRKSAPSRTRNTRDVHNTGVQRKHSNEAEVRSSRRQSLEQRNAHTGPQETGLHSPSTRYHFSPDTLTESGFSETLMSSASDDVFFSSEAPNTATTYRTTSESDSPYSSLTSVSSNTEVNYPWRSGTKGPSQYNGYERARTAPWTGVTAVESNNSSPLTLSHGSNNEWVPSEGSSEPLVRSFRLSPLPRPTQITRTLHDKLMSDIIPPVNSVRPLRVSSPVSSVDTSELSISDTVCECLHQCECQTGIPSAEDFREELKTISRYVLNARQKSSSVYSRPQRTYFVDEEQGEMEIFEGHLQRKENKAVPMLVKVILRLRKHFFGTLESKTPNSAKGQNDVNNNDPASSHEVEEEMASGQQRGRKISFSPSAMLLSAIGENSAAEVKAVIEKEKIDVNQLSPSGRSLLHKAAAAGDLESIHTLIQYGALVNIADQDGFPPIHSALRKAHFKCAILLIECGTDVARYTAARIQEFLDINDMTSGHLQVLLKTNL